MMAKLKEKCIIITWSVLYIPIATPPPSLKSNTVYCIGSPLSGVNLISNFPGPGTTKSVALYCKNE